MFVTKDGSTIYFETPFKDEFGCSMFFCCDSGSFWFESKNYKAEFVDRKYFEWVFQNIDVVKGALDAE